MEKKKNNVAIHVIIWVSSGILILAILAYVLNFNDQEISDDAAKWGAFGDYINPFLALINIITFLYLSYQLSHLDENQAKEDRKTQKIIALNQMRMDAVNDIAKILDHVTCLPNKTKLIDGELALILYNNLNNALDSYKFFIHNKEHLFERFSKSIFNNQDFLDLEGIMKELLSHVKKMNELNKDYIYQIQSNHIIQTEDEINEMDKKIYDQSSIINNKLPDYVKCKIRCTSALYKYIYDQMSTE